MTYALGRRLELRRHADGPRASSRQAAAGGYQHVGVRRSAIVKSAGVPDEERGRAGDARRIERVARRRSRQPRRRRRCHSSPESTLPRRTMLRGLGATVALPFLDAMVPARGALAEDGARRRRSIARGWSASRWCTARPAAATGARASTSGRRRRPGATFDLAPSVAQPARAVPQVPDHRQRHRRARRRSGHAAGDRRRPLPLERGVPDAGASEADRELGRARRHLARSDLRRQRFGQDTPIPSMQLCIENVDQAGGCAYGYSCVYTDMISWASPTEPLPMIRDPRMAFDQLFGAGGSTDGARRAAPRDGERARLRHRPGRRSQPAARRRAIAQRMERYLEDVREIERRIQRVEARNMSGERARAARRAGRRARLVRRARQADVRPAGARVPGRRDARVLVQDGPRRVEPRLPGERRRPRASIPRRTTANKPANITEFGQINQYHVSLLPYFLREAAVDPGGRRDRCSTRALIIYGSPMGDGNVHNHKRCPLIRARRRQRPARRATCTSRRRRARRWRTRC